MTINANADSWPGAESTAGRPEITGRQRRSGSVTPVVIPSRSVETESTADWNLPDRGRIGVLCLMVTEAALFAIFVVAYVFYIGASSTGPFAKDVLELPIWPTVCLLSSSVTVMCAEHALNHRRSRAFLWWVLLTAALGLEFLRQTALEWRRLMVDDHLTISTNVFGTTFYSLVGLHASHVIVGLGLFSLVLVVGVRGRAMLENARRFQLLAWYWHFVDGVWIVVFSVVYVVGR